MTCHTASPLQALCKPRGSFLTPLRAPAALSLHELATRRPLGSWPCCWASCLPPLPKDLLAFRAHLPVTSRDRPGAESLQCVLTGASHDTCWWRLAPQGRTCLWLCNMHRPALPGLGQRDSAPAREMIAVWVHRPCVLIASQGRFPSRHCEGSSHLSRSPSGEQDRVTPCTLSLVVLVGCTPSHRPPRQGSRSGFRAPLRG